MTLLIVLASIFGYILLSFITYGFLYVDSMDADGKITDGDQGFCVFFGFLWPVTFLIYIVMTFFEHAGGFSIRFAKKVLRSQLERKS